MNKFHLVNTESSLYDTTYLKKVEEFVRTTNKILFFTDIKVNINSMFKILELYTEDSGSI